MSGINVTKQHITLTHADSIYYIVGNLLYVKNIWYNKTVIVIAYIDNYKGTVCLKI